MEGLVVKVKERSLLFDNIKTVLIILVVLGHALEEISLEHEYGIIRACIYSFHMPAFIFISGYFSGGGYAKESKKIIVNCGIPLIVKVVVSKNLYSCFDRLSDIVLYLT